MKASRWHTYLVLAALMLLMLTAWADQTLTEIKDKPLAPGFNLPDLDGKTHTLADYHGQLLIVNFWATWCPPCREEMPSMNRAWHQVKDEGIAMVAINVGEDEDTVFTFTGDYPVDFPILLDQDSSTVNRWPVRGLPTTFVIDPQGRLVYQAIGGRAWDDPKLLDRIRTLKQAP